jgi:hypothetical protein
MQFESAESDWLIAFISLNDCSRSRPSLASARPNRSEPARSTSESLEMVPSNRRLLRAACDSEGLAGRSMRSIRIE